MRWRKCHFGGFKDRKEKILNEANRQVLLWNAAEIEMGGTTRFRPTMLVEMISIREVCPLEGLQGLGKPQKWQASASSALH
jgi:hypothetical protein